MASRSLDNWERVRCRELDEIDAAHRSIGGTRRGRRFATRQVNYAYTVLLASHFQGFCRDLHSESVEHLTSNITPLALRASCREMFAQARKLDRGNANSGSIGSDYNTLGLAFWDEVKALDKRNSARLARLDQLNKWRNAIAHQDFTQLRVGPALHLHRVRGWRRTCGRLANSFDQVMRRHLHAIVGVSPW